MYNINSQRSFLDFPARKQSREQGIAPINSGRTPLFLVMSGLG